MQVTKQLRKSGRGHSQKWWKLWALKIWSSMHVKHWSRQLTGMYSVTGWPMHRQSVVHFLSHTSVDPWNLSQQLVTPYASSVLSHVIFLQLWPCYDEVYLCNHSSCWILHLHHVPVILSCDPLVLVLTAHVFMQSQQICNLTKQLTLLYVNTCQTKCANVTCFPSSSLEQAKNLREVQVMRRLSPHANIIQLHDLILWVLECHLL